MAQIKDIMMFNPPFLFDINTIGQAKIVARHSKISSIPVVTKEGDYLGILEKELVLEDRLPDRAKVKDYINIIKSLNNADPISILETLPELPDNMVIPVLNDKGRLAGVIPQPKLFRGTCSSIIRSLKSVSKVDNIENADLTTIGIIIINDEGKIVCFNYNAEKILGVKCKDIYGIHINLVLHDSKLCEVVKKGHPHFKEKMKADQVYLCSNRFPLYEGDLIAGAIGIFEDITEQEKLHKNLRKLRGLNVEMVGILESIDDGIVVFDNWGRILRINSTFELITNLSAQEILESNIEQLINRGCLPAVILPEALYKKKSIHVIERISGRDYLFIASPIFNGDGDSNGLIIIIKDISYLNELVLNLQVAQQIANTHCLEATTLRDHAEKREVVAASFAMKKVVSLAQKVAKVNSNCLITGETGVGKEVIAERIHTCSNRKNGPFIKLNCGAIPEPLLESELFGYEAGAFSGAKREGKQGLIELADGGTLFLDEIGDLAMNLQVKMLRVLQEREVMRVGGTQPKKVDFRLIAATHKDLLKMIKEKSFREDLYYRLNVIPFFIPPLRERKEDILPLSILFLNKFNIKYGLSKKISPDVIQNLVAYDWPGNIRELENTIERLVVTSDGNLILESSMKNAGQPSAGNENEPKLMLNVVEETEKQLILKALEQCRTTREMAGILGISQSAVVKKMKKYGINKKQASE